MAKEKLSSKEQRDLQKQRQKAKEEKDKADLEFLESFAQTTRFELTFNRQAFYFLVGLMTVFLPAYLFQGVLDLDVAGFNIVLYVVVSTISAYILSLGYHNYFLRTRPRVGEKYEKIVNETRVKLNRQLKNEVAAEQEYFTDVGSTGYAIAFGNTVFMIAALFLSLYVLKAADIRMRYVISVIAAAGLSFWLSTGQSKRKRK